MNKSGKLKDLDQSTTLYNRSELSREKIKEIDETLSIGIKKMRGQMTSSEQLLSKLLHLKFTMEDYIQSSILETKYSFGFFLKEYIHKSDKTLDLFASEITCDKTTFNSYLKNKAIPDEKFLVRLSIHSNKLIPTVMWWKILEKQKEKEIVEEEKNLWSTERQYVKKLDVDLV